MLIRFNFAIEIYKSKAIESLRISQRNQIAILLPKYEFCLDKAFLLASIHQY